MSGKLDKTYSSEQSHRDALRVTFGAASLAARTTAARLVMCPHFTRGLVVDDDVLNQRPKELDPFEHLLLGLARRPPHDERRRASRRQRPVRGDGDADFASDSKG